MKIRPIWLLALLTALPAPVAQGALQAAEICHIANAGFAVHGPTGTVLFDALFRNGLPDYQRASDELNEKMETGAAPFDDVKFVIVTHMHADHFSAKALVRHVKHNPHTHYIVTPQARERMAAAGLTEADGSRVQAVYPANDEKRVFRHADITVTVYRVSHGKGTPAQNIGVLVETGGMKLFHPGDMVPDADELAGAGLRKLGVDVALLPFWVLMGDGDRKLMSETFAATHFVPMHVPVVEQPWMAEYGGLAGLRKLIESNLRNTFWMTDEMACRTIAATAP